ncbi:MAG: hypothetical protein U0736_11060 [Gemmataceae bacterium]
MRESLRKSDLLRDLAEVRTASAALRVGQRLEFDLRGQLLDEAAAQRLGETLPGLITKGRFLLPVLATMRGGEEGKLLGRLGGLLGKIKPEQAGTEVYATVEVDAADVVERRALRADDAAVSKALRGLAGSRLERRARSVFSQLEGRQLAAEMAVPGGFVDRLPQLERLDDAAGQLEVLAGPSSAICSSVSPWRAVPNVLTQMLIGSG